MIFQTCCVSACVVGWEVWWSWLCCVNVFVTKPSYLMIWQPIKKDLSCLGERERGSGSLWADLCLIWKSWKENKGGRNHVFSFFHGSCEERRQAIKSGWEREALLLENAAAFGTLLPWRHVTIATGAGDEGLSRSADNGSALSSLSAVQCVCVLVYISTLSAPAVVTCWFCWPYSWLMHYYPSQMTAVCVCVGSLVYL